MGFKDQIKLDMDTVIFNTDEFAENATLTTLEGVDYPIVIIKTGEVGLVFADPGAVDMDTFLVKKSDSFVISPNYKITDENGVIWTAQPGIKSDDFTWTVPVISNRRVKA